MWKIKDVDGIQCGFQLTNAWSVDMIRDHLLCAGRREKTRKSSEPELIKSKLRFMQYFWS